MTAALVGLGASLWAGSTHGPRGDDEATYHTLARNIQEGRGMSLDGQTPTALRAPLYPAFLAVVYTLLGRGDGAVLLAQAFVSGLACALLTAIALLLFGRWTAVVTLLLSGANLPLWRWAGSRLTETLFVALVIVSILALVLALQGSKLRWFAIAGAIVGLAVLCRPTAVVMLPFLGAVVFFAPAVRKPERGVAVLLAGTLAVVLPWVARNRLEFGRFIPVQAHAFGANFWLTTIDQEDQPVVTWVGTGERLRAKYPEFAAYAVAGSGTIQRLEAERALVRAGLGRIARNPGGYILSRLRTYPHLWLHSGGLWGRTTSFREALRRRDLATLSAKTASFMTFSLAPLGLALAALFRFRRSWRLLLPLLIVPVSIGLVHLPLWIEPRYSLPAVPFLLVLAAAMLTGGGRTRERRAPAVDLRSPPSDVSVVILSRNEGSVVVHTAEAVRAGGGGPIREVIVVDGHSSDGSAQALQEAGFTVVSDNGHGKGDGVRCGIAAARGDIIVFMDADGSHEPADISRLVEPLRQGQADLVVGCRMRGGSDEFAGSWALFVRLWGNNVLTLLLNSRFGVSMTDSQNGFRAGLRSMLLELDLREDKHSIELEMIMKSLKKGYRVLQVPSHEYSRRRGESSLSVVKQTPRFLLCVLKNLW